MFRAYILIMSLRQDIKWLTLHRKKKVRMTLSSLHIYNIGF